MKLLVGLGNPGAKYAHTRHNAGFMAVDMACRMINAEFDREVCSSLVAEVVADGEKFLFAKPLTYMNLSGTAVKALMKKFSLRAEDLTVIHDDIDVAFGKIKEKVGGGSGGHNGIASIAENLQTPDFHRVRIGVGRPSAGMDAAEYVLSPFEKAEIPVLEGILEECCKRILKLV